MGATEARPLHAVHRRMLTSSATIGALASVVKIAGAAKVIVTARYFGTSDVMDAFLVAFILPSFVADAIAGTLTPSMIPVLVSAAVKGDERAAERIVRSVSAVALVVTVATGVLLAAAAPLLIRMLGWSFPPPKLNLAVRLYLVLLFWIPGGACIATWRAFLNARGHFALPAFAPIATPLFTLLALWTSAASFGPYALCLGTLAGVAVECSILAWGVRRLGCRIAPIWIGWTEELSQIWLQYLPLTAGVLVSSAGIIVDQMIAATFGSGGVSEFAYGTRVVTVLLAVAATATGTAALPLFSRLATERDGRRVRTIGGWYVAGVFGAGLVLAVVLMYYSTPIVKIVLQHGAFAATSTQAVARIQRLALVQMPFALALALLIRLAAAMRRSSVLGRIAVLGFVVNLIADVLLARWLGIAGIALATAAVQAASLAALSWVLFSREKGISA